MLKTDSVKGRWCGPFALATLTGKTYEEADRLLAGIQEKQSVKGSYDPEIILALGTLGYSAHSIHLGTGMPPTLGRFLRDRSPIEQTTPILIGIHAHWATCHFGWFADNWTKKPVPIADTPKPKRPVVSAYLIRRRIK